MNCLVDEILDWHIDKFGENGPEYEPSVDKFLEECEEFQKSEKAEEMVDVIVTALGVLISSLDDRKQVRKEIKDKLETISNRKGKVINGQFVKESDLNDEV